MKQTLTLPRLIIALFAVCMFAVGPAHAASSTPKPKVTLNVTKAQEIAPGRKVTLSATATNATGYQWFNGTQSIAGATTSSYEAGSDGTYLCQATGPGGSAKSKSVKVSVVYAPASLAGYTLVANGTFTTLSQDSLEGKNTEQIDNQITLNISSDGKNVTVNDGANPEETYPLTYSRKGNKATLTSKKTTKGDQGTYSYTDSTSITITLNLNGYDAVNDIVTGTFSAKVLSKGTYSEGGTKGRYTETTTGSGSVALDAPAQ